MACLSRALLQPGYLQHPGTLLGVHGWKEHVPSPCAFAALCRGVSFWQSLMLEEDRCLVSDADVSRCLPAQERASPAPDPEWHCWWR